MLQVYTQIFEDHLQLTQCLPPQYIVQTLSEPLMQQNVQLHKSCHDIAYLCTLNTQHHIDELILEQQDHKYIPTYTFAKIQAFQHVMHLCFQRQTADDISSEYDQTNHIPAPPQMI